MKRIYLLLITMGMMAMANAQDRPRFQGMRDVNNVIDNTADSLEKANQVRPVSGSSRKGNNPVMYISCPSPDSPMVIFECKRPL